jgi:uracil-DNA glycosylase
MLIYSNGNKTDPKVVVICDAPSAKAYQEGQCMSRPVANEFKNYATDAGFVREDFAFIIPCPPLREEDTTSDAVTKAVVLGYRNAFMDEFAKLLATGTVKLIIYLGKHAGLQYEGKSVKITTARGQITKRDDGIMVAPMLSPQHIMKRPEVKPLFLADWSLVGKMRSGGWSYQSHQNSRTGGPHRL